MSMPDLGQYTVYVLSSYAVTLGLLAAIILASVWQARRVRARLEAVAAKAGLPFVAPPLALCTDNAAMIAFAGLLLFEAGQRDDMTLSARPRWPLDVLAAPLTKIQRDRLLVAGDD